MAVTVAASPESEIQSILTEQGYNIGAIDGAIGKKTLLKLKDFCQLHALDCKPYIAQKNYIKVLSLVNSVQGLDVRPLAPFSQIASENTRRPNQVKHLGVKGVAVGNFDNEGELELFIVETPKAYNKYLWGQETSFVSLPKSYTKAGLRKSKDLNWIDKMSFKNRLNTELKPIKIEGSEEFCLHNRSPVSADFNSDGIDDILVPCHGYDGYPFPGDHSYVILSQGNQVFKAIKITTKKGFYHGGTIFDVNKDGNFPRAQLVSDAGVRGAFAFPIKDKNHVTHVLEFFSPEPEHLNPSVLELMKLISNQVSRGYYRND